MKLKITNAKPEVLIGIDEGLGYFILRIAHHDDRYGWETTFYGVPQSSSDGLTLHVLPADFYDWDIEKQCANKPMIIELQKIPKSFSKYPYYSRDKEVEEFAFLEEKNKQIISYHNVASWEHPNKFEKDFEREILV